MLKRDNLQDGTGVEGDIRIRTESAVAQLNPQQMANIVNAGFLIERESPVQELQASEAAADALRARFSDYFTAAARVASRGSAADRGRFRRLRREQRALAKAADGAAVAAAGPLMVTAAAMAAAALAASALDFINEPQVLGCLALSAALYWAGKMLSKKRTSLLWNGVFADSGMAARVVWYSAAEAAAAQLIRRRERDAPAFDAGLRAVEASWEERNYAGKMFDEDYSGLTGRY